MGEQKESENHIQGQSPAGSAPQLLNQFKADWEAALQGRPQPEIGVYLDHAPEPERIALRAELQGIELEYRHRLEEGTGTKFNVTTEFDRQATGEETAELNLSKHGGEDEDFADSPPTAAYNSEDRGFAEPGDSSGCRSPESRTSSAVRKALDGLEDYELLEELGRGGMGVVYKAREKSVSRIVALKMMLGGEFASPEAVRRFQIEAESVASLDHPNIIPIYHVGEINGMPYFAMKYVEGASLDRFGRGRFKTDPRAAAELVRKVCLAVHFAHQRGILHRDLKPANILIDQQGEPHITDFGLAKRMDQDHGQTQTGMVMGTPEYMSPEQAAGLSHKVSVASDVYSLGSILFDLLTGEPPFRSKTMMQTLIRVTKEPARSPTSLNRSVGLDLETICLKCLEKEPERRYSSAQEISAELERYLQGRPIHGRRVGKLERAGRWCKRNPVVASLTAVVLVLMIAWLVGLNVALLQISRERDTAERARKSAEQKKTQEIIARQKADENERAAKRARDLASYNEALLHKTLYDVVDVFQDGLRDQPGQQELRQQLLDLALEQLDRVEQGAKNVGAVPDSANLALRTAAAAHQRGGAIFLQLGLIDRALESFQRAQELIMQMDRANPTDPSTKRNLAACCNNLADTYTSLGKFNAARDQYRKGLDYRIKWVELLTQQPKLDKWELVNAKWDTAISCVLLSEIHLALGDPETALDYLKKSDEWAAAVPQDAKPSMKDVLEKAKHAEKYGDASLRLGNLDLAEDYYQRAIKMLDKYLEKIQKRTAGIRIRKDLARLYLRMGDARLQYADDPQGAQTYYRQAAELCLDLSQQDPRNVVVAVLVGKAYYKQGTVALRLGDASASAEFYQKCLGLREQLVAASPADQPLQIDLMMALARCGRHVDAAKIAARIRREISEPVGAYAAASCYAVCAANLAAGQSAEDTGSAANSYASQAIAALEHALNHGWKDLQSVKRSPDLDSIRAHPDFNQLLQGR